MNKRKILITKLPWGGREFLAAALAEDFHILELRLEEPGSASILGNIYIGQVQKLQPFMNCAFVDIRKDMPCFLSLEEQKQPGFPVLRADHSLRPMDALPVQVTREAGRNKNPRVTARLSLSGPHMVLEYGQGDISVSKKLSRKERDRLRRLGGMLDMDGSLHLLFRTAAEEATEEELREEFAGLNSRMADIRRKAVSRPVFTCIHESEPFYMAMIREQKAGSLQEIRTDVPEIFSLLQNTAPADLSALEQSDCKTRLQQQTEVTPGSQQQMAGKTGLLQQAAVTPQSQQHASGKTGSQQEMELRSGITFYEDPLLPMYKLYRLETVLEKALQEKVWLPSGGFLMIQPTEAFVSVDVNSGKYAAKKVPEEIYRNINLEAAKVLAAQLRLRNLSGMILVDFINMEKEEHRQEVMECLRRETSEDPAETVVVDMTALHIVEITRRKVRKPLAEQIKSY